MTDKQLLKLNGKHIRFTFREYRYALKNEVIEGIVEPEETVIYLNRDNTLKPYKHYDMLVKWEGKARCIPFNKLVNISNLEILEK